MKAPSVGQKGRMKKVSYNAKPMPHCNVTVKYSNMLFNRQRCYFSKENVNNDNNVEKSLHFLMRLMVIMTVVHIPWRS